MTVAEDTAVYKIKLQGHITLNWSTWINAVAITHSDDGTTIVVGEIQDQAALHGILAKTRDFGVVILSVTRLAKPTSGRLE